MILLITLARFWHCFSLTGLAMGYISNFAMVLYVCFQLEQGSVSAQCLYAVLVHATVYSSSADHWLRRASGWWFTDNTLVKGGLGFEILLIKSLRGLEDENHESQGNWLRFVGEETLDVFGCRAVSVNVSFPWKENQWGAKLYGNEEIRKQK